MKTAKAKTASRTGSATASKVDPELKSMVQASLDAYHQEQLKQLTSEQVALLALQLAPPRDRKAIERFCSKHGVPIAVVVRVGLQGMGSSLGDGDDVNILQDLNEHQQELKREASAINAQAFAPRPPSAEQKGWLALELLSPMEQKAFTRFCNKLGVGPHHLIQHCVGGFHPDGMKDSDFIMAVLDVAGRL
jgi:hypothetical protein